MTSTQKKVEASSTQQMNFLDIAEKNTKIFKNAADVICRWLLMLHSPTVLSALQRSCYQIMKEPVGEEG